jgi:hypothetical protein
MSYEGEPPVAAQLKPGQLQGVIAGAIMQAQQQRRTMHPTELIRAGFWLSIGFVVAQVVIVAVLIGILVVVGGLGS